MYRTTPALEVVWIVTTPVEEMLLVPPTMLRMRPRVIKRQELDCADGGHVQERLAGLVDRIKAELWSTYSSLLAKKRAHYHLDNNPSVASSKEKAQWCQG